MRHLRSVGWLLTIIASAVLGSWASRALLSSEATGAESTGSAPVSHSVGIVRDAEADAIRYRQDHGDVGLLPAVAGDPGEVIPDPDTRLREQINTLRLGAIAAGPPVELQRGSSAEASQERSASMLGWAVLIGGALIIATAAVYRILRVRRAVPPAGPPSPARSVRTAEAPVERAEFEASMRRVQESILEVIQLVEEIHQRIEEIPSASVHESAIARHAAPEPPEILAESEQPEDPDARGPWADRELSLPAPSTTDGRDLTAIRRAVLLLSEQGWKGERIAERLRLGRGDVGLILKSGSSGVKAGERIEYAAGRR